MRTRNALLATALLAGAAVAQKTQASSAPQATSPPSSGNSNNDNDDSNDDNKSNNNNNNNSNNNNNNKNNKNNNNSDEAQVLPPITTKPADNKPTTTASAEKLPQPTKSIPSTANDEVNELPKLSPEQLDMANGFFGEIPVPTIPPTKNAPFMQQSTLPEGTVFIGVGAGLAACLVILFLWRALVAWSLHRSVRSAGFAPMPGKLKSKKHGAIGGGGTAGSGRDYEKEMAALKPVRPQSNLYGGGGAPGSVLSLDNLHNASRSPANASGLFYSPTGNPNPSMSGLGGMGAGSGRQSAYYPAGFYGAPGNRQSVASFNNVRGGLNGHSPPGTPVIPASRGTERGLGGIRGGMNESQSSLSLPPTGRAPSAVLEDLFESHRNSGRY